ncbi:hypothetical protein ACLMAJ_12090 [Nocardia sp. KC 131]|uniref:hypothetical protein n=1 Tax=Nocardia arseniciresistens TaxID=3392119 RepID=UPI00398F5721
MTINATYTMAGAEIKLVYAAESGDLELGLGQTFSPFDGSHQLRSTPADHEPGAGAVLSATVEHHSVGRGGPIVRTAQVTVFLPDAPEPGPEAADLAATGAFVLADPEARSDATPQYQAVALTGNLVVSAAAPAGRF